MKKKISVLVIISICILKIVYADEIDKEDEIIKNNGNIDNDELIQESSDELKNKTKRGIFYVGRGLPSSSYATIYGYQTPFINTPLVKPVATAANHIPYIIRPGGAAIHSYNVNYLRYPYYNQKAFANFYPFSTAFNQILPSSSVIPTNTFVPAAPIVPASPVIPTHPVVSAFPAHPIIPASPVFPSVPIAPSPSSAPVPAPAAPAPIPVPSLPTQPLFTNTFFIPQRPVIPLPVSPQRPVLIPSATGTFPSVLPIPGTRPTVPTTAITPTQTTTTSTITPSVSPSFPTPQYPHGGQPWRPVHQTPSASIPSSSSHHPHHHYHFGIHRPSITLLPPYEGTSNKGSLEDFQSIPSREYLTPLQRHQIAAIQSKYVVII